MTSSRLHLYLILTLSILLPILTITVFHLPIYFFLQNYYPETSLVLTSIVYTTTLATYFIIFPITKLPTDNKQTTEET